MIFAILENNLTLCPICYNNLVAREDRHEDGDPFFFGTYCPTELVFNPDFDWENPTQYNSLSIPHFELMYQEDLRILTWNKVIFEGLSSEHAAIFNRVERLVEQYHGEELATEIRSLMERFLVMK